MSVVSADRSTEVRVWIMNDFLTRKIKVNGHVDVGVSVYALT